MLVLSLLLGINSAYSSDNSIDLLLKARGLQALERIEKLSKKNGDSKGSNLTKKESSEWAYENMYFAFAHPELSKIVKKSVYQSISKDATAYIFIIMDDKSNSMGFQMNYIYAKSTDRAPLISEISTIKEGWRVKVFERIPGMISVLSPDCLFTFSLKDPLETTFETSK